MAISEAKLQVRVPASSANLGPGFDVLGLALDFHNRFTVQLAETTVVEVSGYGEELPTGESNLFYRAFMHLYTILGRTPPPLHVTMDLDVPPGRGLGSSATAVVGGLVAANALLGGAFSKVNLLGEAIKLERGGHADNIAPALLGGLVAIVMTKGEIVTMPVPFPDDLRAVLFIPDFQMDTVQGRALMPESYSAADVVFNTSRVALFLAAITGRRYELLKLAMEDRLHQPYRSQLFPQLPLLITAALDGGAHGACLSGGGSSVLALATEKAEEIVEALQATAERTGIRGVAKVVGIDYRGAQVNPEQTM